VAGQWFSPVSSTNKTDSHDITEILLKVALNTINQTKTILLIRSCVNDDLISFEDKYIEYQRQRFLTVY